MKKIALFVGVLTLLFPQAAPTAVAEPHGITCDLTGTAKLKPGLTMEVDPYGETRTYKVTFTGELSNCQSSGDAASGTVKAQATAEGSCAHATAEGHALIKWDNGNKSHVVFSTEDVGALVVLDFEIAKSNDDAAASGDQGYGLLVFQADPMDCQSSEGIKEASFDGQVGSGGS